MNSSNRVCLNIGSNFEAKQNLSACLDLLHEQCDVLAVSGIHQSVAVGSACEGENFLNMAVLISTGLTAAILRDTILRPMETALGRSRSQSDSKIIVVDIDITVFADQQLQLGKRLIPDPDIARYLHIALPLSEVMPGYFHDETQEPIVDIVKRLNESTA